MVLLQSELHKTRELWNNHRIREVQNSECPADCTNALYYLTPTTDEHNLSFDVRVHDVELGRSFCQNDSKPEWPEEMLKCGLIVLAEKHFEDPSSTIEAEERY